MTRAQVALLGLVLCGISANASSTHDSRMPSPSVRKLQPPSSGVINVAFLVSDNTDLIDVAGPWEVFSDTMLTREGKPWQGGNDMVMPFHVYTVSDSQTPVSAESLRIIPNYTFANAPRPQVIVVPAQGGRSEAQKKWLLDNARTAGLTMSVCTGASMLAADGLLDGETATTHHLYIGAMQRKYPKVHFVTGVRYVDHGKIATAGGLSSGIDLALHVVERYYGAKVAQATADYMEYRGVLWKNPQYGPIKPVSNPKRGGIRRDGESR